MSSISQLRIIIADREEACRAAACAALADFSHLTIVGQVASWSQLLASVGSQTPDLVVVDEATLRGVSEPIEQLRSSRPQLGVIVSVGHVSAISTWLEAGAFDVAEKPSGGPGACWRTLLSPVQAYRRSKGLTRSSTPDQPAAAAPPTVSPPTTPSQSPASAPPATRQVPPPEPNSETRVLCVGASTGGPEALRRFLSGIPKDFSLPIAIVQHMPPNFTARLAESLDAQLPLHVFEARHRQCIKPRDVAIAPGGKHLELRDTSIGLQTLLSDGPEENGCRPAADVLFRSIAQRVDGAAIAVVLTGMGEDGAKGCRLLHQRGDVILAQSEESCVVYGMPKQVVNSGVTTYTGSPEELSGWIQEYVESIPCR